ncbi:helix-turn-helix transcriptional regulator [Micromonospora peucetia]|uniref:Helix-turn-helix transcriptional regulator n=1 Tax=Micromonospora peucetia TaxID=47871 RepID=A0ABZ1E9W9_9ACTN|nr:helix-turn-helix transcriptional regulator [Micromonospora peucetia]MCX4388018.1 helix-turn-helix transcriptional regulator [Micromonospora peucetia]WSA31292.1 helix-turn-helix transcriptional regulator [Micromonospora peucetia]
MDNRDEVRDFLITRRERLTPEQAGVPFFGGKRRVKGLRREEVAMLAGISTDYYTRLERGNLAGVSHSVLEALFRALQLDEAERTHLFNLADTANAIGRAVTGRPPRRPTSRTIVRQGVQRILDTINAPAYARNGCLDVLAMNRLGHALYADAVGTGATFNLARHLFLDLRSQDFYREWETVAADCVAALRTQAGRTPYDRGLTDLIGELSTRSAHFRTWWATHNVRLHHTATKTMHHAIAGDLELTGEALQLPGDPDLTIVTYTFEPTGPTAQALAFLSTWCTPEASGRTTGSGRGTAHPGSRLPQDPGVDTP